MPPVNDYYDSTGFPATRAAGSSSAARAELDLIEAAFNKLPTLTGNGSKAVVVNAGGTALTVTTGTLTLAGNLSIAAAFTTSGANSLTLTTTGATNVTLPTTGTLSTLAGTEEFTGKTLNASVGKGTWTKSGTWTLPAFTMNDVLTCNGQIAFPAAQNASSDANTLDDYEEGTFTPTILGSSGHAPGAYFAQIGRYTKVGNRVDWALEVQINGYGTLINGETMRIQGFPFTLGSGTGYPGVICGRLNGSPPAPLSTASWPHVVQVDGDTDIYLYKSGAEDSLLKEDIASNQPLFASGTIWV